MDLKQHIKENYGSQTAFAKMHDKKIATVNYWCNTEWKKLNYSKRVDICKLLNLEMDF